ncbi:MAG: DUF1667 domain-containing protein [Clostridiales bacterium]|nr:DUF1667 domain-containing protein [Clostridiales bacterium]MBQ2818330.1 DUF1667 domain-containing protein [Clostridia bacterium]
MKEFVCINCPVGCRLQVFEESGKIIVKGHTCKRGETYGVAEYTDPVRMVTSIMRVEGKNSPVPCRLSQAVSKKAIPEVLDAIAKATAPKGAKQYDVLIKNVAGTQADVIATANA